MGIFKQIGMRQIQNAIIYGFIPTLIFYICSTDFADFIEKIQCFKMADSIAIYLSVLFFVPATLSWSSFWVKINSKWLRSFIKNLGASLQSLYFAVSGICFALAALLLRNVSMIEEAIIIFIVIIIGLVFFVGGILVILIIPAALRP